MGGTDDLTGAALGMSSRKRVVANSWATPEGLEPMDSPIHHALAGDLAPIRGSVAPSLLRAIGGVTIGHGAIWSQVAALALMAPAAALGGWLRARQAQCGQEAA